MGMQISGIATVPTTYYSNSGKAVEIRPEDIQSAINNSANVNFQIGHDELAEPVGEAFALRMNSKGGMYYCASIDNEYTENMIQSIFDDGKIPNVSVNLVPTEDATIEVTATEDGTEKYTADSWRLGHIGIVDSGRCKPEQGCGIFDYQILNSSKGDVMTDNNDVGKEELALELSELKDTISKKDEKISKLESGVKDLELALSEAEDTIKQFKEQQLEEKRNAILKLDDSIEADELKEVKDPKALELMLSGLRDRTSRKHKAQEEDKENDINDVLADFKKAVYGA